MADIRFYVELSTSGSMAGPGVWRRKTSSPSSGSIAHPSFELERLDFGGGKKNTQD